MNYYYRYPHVALNKNGTVEISRCSCEQALDGHCSHVGALLYLIEDVSLGVQPRLQSACTSQPRTWGKGKKSSKNPDPIYEKQYSKKRRPDRIINFDPRPVHLQHTSENEINEFIFNVQSLQRDSMWSKILPFHYGDYELSNDRKSVLHEETKMFLENQKQDLMRFVSDPLSNGHAVHCTGTEKQADCPEWFQCRHYKVTASTFYDFLGSAKSACNKLLFQEKRDISHLLSIKWGRDHENEALAEV